MASSSQQLCQLVRDRARRTCDDDGNLPCQVHDFGYHGVSSEETAALSGAAHLVNVLGSDTVPAVCMPSQFDERPAIEYPSSRSARPRP